MEGWCLSRAYALAASSSEDCHHLPKTVSSKQPTWVDFIQSSQEEEHTTAKNAVSKLHQVTPERSKKSSRICLKRGVILKHNLLSTAENQCFSWFYPDSNWRSFGMLGERGPGLFEPLLYHFRWADFDGGVGGGEGCILR